MLIRRETRRRRKSTHLPLLILITVFAVCAAVFLWRGGRWLYQYFSRPARYENIIRAAGLRNQIDPALIKAVIWKESRFDRNARGLKGEIGLMQIMPGPKFAAADWAKAHRCKLPSPGALYDPALNIDVGAWYLARAIRRYAGYRDAVALGLCEYNAGPQRASDWKPQNPKDPVIDRISIPSTKIYVRDILDRYHFYKEQEKTTRRKGAK